MPAFLRSGGQWVETTPFSRNASAWSESTDELYVRDAGEWKLIHPDPASELLPVEDLAVTSGPTHFSVTIGWTDPEQPILTPTHVQVRIAELGAVWTEYDYLTTEASWGALEASTTYVAQVRYIVRTNGIVTAMSVTQHVEFTTTAAPIGAPAEDPGAPGGTDTSWPLGGSTGNPTAPSTPDGCWWEWKLQILDQDTTTINWQDTGITGTADGDAEDITYDTTSLDNTRTYRLCIREACDTDSDGTADDFGDWSCSAPFAGAFDWGVTCGSVPLAPVVELDAAADAVWAFPRYCAVGDGLDTTGIVDAISNTQIGKGADFAAIYTTTDGEWGVVADADGGITLTAGLAAISTNVGAGLDFTIGARRRLSPGHSFSNGRTTTIASIGGGAIVIQAVETATGWYPTASFRLTSGYVTLSGSGDEITTKGDVHTIALRWDADGDKKLALDGFDVDSDTSGDDLHASVTVQPMYWTAEVGLGSTMQQLGWNRVLTDDEIVELNGGGLPTRSLSVVGSMTLGAGTTQLLDLAVQGDYAYTTYQGRVATVSLSTPSSPTNPANYYPSVGSSVGFGHYANDLWQYFDSGPRVFIYDLASPPAVNDGLNASYVASGYAAHMAGLSNGTCARVTTNGVHVHSGSNGAQLGFLSVAMQDRQRPGVIGTTVFALSSTGAELRAYDCSTSTPALLGSLTLSASGTYAIHADPTTNRVYLLVDDGLIVVNAVNPAAMVEVGSLSDSRFGTSGSSGAPGMVAYANTLAVQTRDTSTGGGSYDTWLMLVDVSNLAAMTVKAAVSIGTSARGLATYDDQYLISVAGNTLTIYEA